MVPAPKYAWFFASGEGSELDRDGLGIGRSSRGSGVLPISIPLPNSSFSDNTTPREQNGRPRIHHGADCGATDRRELIRFGIWVALGLAVLALVGLYMWTRWVWECSLL